MNKKEYLIKLLEQLSPMWSLAKWFKVIVEQWELQDSVIDMLMEAIQWAVHTVKDEFAQEKLQKWMTYLQEMKNIEDQEKMEDEAELQKLDQLLQDF